ncbi:SIMPL domain-containing protein [uncultured Croceicoccus sp.]|uniref:SIMPL domain-containing protein n=1 Tax=uncultured Croceicoccus sp. TaxID=1295329 RepID=UPI0026372B73|nr:SIMPL domain-containing protein [uncultured Croceicoccus sp.]
MRKPVFLFAAPAMAVAALSGGTISAHAAEVQLQASGPVVELGVSETVLADPDMATVGAGVTTRAPTASQAMQENARKMTAVVERIAALGIPDDRIQTTGISLNPRYNYRNDDVPQFLGYDATNNVRIELRDMERVGAVLDALVEAGATNLSGPDFGLIDPKSAQAQARRAAFERGMTQATELARMAGYTGVRLLSVEEAVSENRPMQRDMIVVTGSRTEAASSPVKPGQVGTAVMLTLKYEMTR